MSIVERSKEEKKVIAKIRSRVQLRGRMLFV
jgi:hypothetical protein